MISTLTVSGSLIVSGGLTVNQLARKGNLVVHLDASVANYTAYQFNSGSRNGTSASILDWPNRWTDLSGNNNHAYPIRANTANNTNGITGYSSSFFPITSSYLDNGVNVFGLGNLGNLNDRGMRFNPIIIENTPFSIFTWVKFNTNTSTFIPDRPQFIIAKQIAGTSISWGLNGLQSTNSGPLKLNFYLGSTDNANSPTYSIVTGSWCQVGATVDSGSASNFINLYINGQLVTTTPITTFPTPVSQQIIMGRPNWASNTVRSNFNMSQLLVYNCALTPQEVWNNYQITKYKHQT